MNDWHNKDKQRENYIQNVNRIRRKARINQIAIIVFALLIIGAILLQYFSN